jgi:hypothetical protein
VPPLITPKLITDSDAEGGSDRYIRPHKPPKGDAGHLITSVWAKKGKQANTVAEVCSALSDGLDEEPPWQEKAIS